MNRATRSELINRIALLHGWSECFSKTIVRSVLKELTALMNDNDEVVLHNFGRFKKVTRSAHTGFHPKTRKPIDIPEVTQFSFRSSRNPDTDEYRDIDDLINLIS